MNKQNIFGLSAPALAQLLANMEIAPYRAKQIAEWMYQRDSCQFDNMTNLPAAMRTMLAEAFVIAWPTVKREQHSTDGTTSKYLLAMSDGECIETVLMRQSYGNSVCISSQVGCAMGCVFCASTMGGMVRNLTAAEMLAQVLHHARTLRSEAQTVSHIVIMGSGEPLANYDEVLAFIRLCHESYVLGLSYRNITLSTSGIVPAIDKLSGEGLPLTLSISLHAPNDAVRNDLMPINQRWSIGEVVAAGARYAQATGRRVTYEYTLIAGKNDSEAHARQLAALIRGQLCNVNLIPVNAVSELGLARPAMAQVNRFARTLEAGRINATIRREMGADIQAACGQLRNQALPTIH